MAAPAVAVMLKAFAQLVAAETGRRISQEIAKKFIGLVFGHLATKDDIANAVKQINAFTAQKFDDLSREEILSPVMAAQTFLKDFELLTADEGYDQAAAYDVAFTAYETCTAAMGRVSYLSSIDSGFLRSNAVLVAKLIVTEIGAASAVASVNASFERVLSRRLVDDVEILKKTASDMQAWEVPKIIKEWTDHHFEPRLPREAHAKPTGLGEYTYRAWLSMQSGRDGVQTFFKLTQHQGEIPGLVSLLRKEAEATIAKRRSAISPTMETLDEAATSLSTASFAQVHFMAAPPLATA